MSRTAEEYKTGAHRPGSTGSKLSGIGSNRNSSGFRGWSYELLHEDGFPSLRIGSRLVVPKEQFRLWVERQTGGTHEE